MRFMVRPLLFLLTFILAESTSITAKPATAFTLPGLLNHTSALDVDRIRFNDTVYDAIRDTRAQYPQAALVFIEARITGDPTNNPELLDDVDLTFTIPRRAPIRSLYVTMTWHWGRWNLPRLSPVPPPANTRIIPDEIGMDILEADQLIKEHGYTDKYLWVDVYWPSDVARERSQVYYFFEMESTEPGTVGMVAVGTRDRIVAPTYN